MNPAAIPPCKILWVGAMLCGFAYDFLAAAFLL
jgi:hypothetical protein